MSHLLNKLSAEQKGVLFLVLGIVLVLGAFDKLGIFQASLNIVLIVVGALLVLHGAQHCNLTNKLKFLKGKK